MGCKGHLKILRYCVKVICSDTLETIRMQYGLHGRYSDTQILCSGICSDTLEKIRMYYWLQWLIFRFSDTVLRDMLSYTVMNSSVLWASMDIFRYSDTVLWWSCSDTLVINSSVLWAAMDIFRYSDTVLWWSCSDKLVFNSYVLWAGRENIQLIIYCVKRYAQNTLWIK